MTTEEIKARIQNAQTELEAAREAQKSIKSLNRCETSGERKLYWDNQNLKSSLADEIRNLNNLLNPPTSSVTDQQLRTIEFVNSKSYDEE